jgi:hypothetical protein
MFAGFAVTRESGDSFESYVAGGATSYSASAFARSVVGFAPDVVGANFVFAQDAFVTRLQQHVPTMDLREEVFAAHDAPEFVILGSGVLLFVSMALAVVLLALTWRRRRPIDAKIASLIVWLGLYWVVVVGRSPATPESWIPALIPFWLLVGDVVFGRLTDGVAYGLAVTFVVIFALETAVGGMAIVRHGSSDLNAARASWLIQHAEPGDVILTADDTIFQRYLSYYTQARVVSLQSESSEEIQSSYAYAVRVPGTVYVMGSVFSPPPELFAQNAADATDILRFGATIRDQYVPVEQTTLVAIYSPR